LEYEFTVQGEKHAVRLDGKPPHARVSVGGREYDVDWTQVPGGAISMIVGSRSLTARVARRDGGLVVWVGGHKLVLETGSADESVAGSAGAHAGASGIIKAPMPGSVVKVLVAPGDQVSVGRSLVIVEAMKMENEVRSPVDGVVKAVNVKAGDSVGTTEVMVEVEPKESD
jgi:acetyl/propionyl-CoA carboxylase alpha subunit